MKFDKKLKCAKVCENRILLASADEPRRLLAKFLVQSHSAAHRKNSSTQMEFKIKGVMTPFLFAPPQILYFRVETKLKTIRISLGLYCYISIYPFTLFSKNTSSLVFRNLSVNSEEMNLA